MKRPLRLHSNLLRVVIIHQGWQSLSGPSGYEDLNKTSVAPNYSFEATKRAIASLKMQVEEASKMEMSKISGAGQQMHLCLHLVEPAFLCRRLDSLVSDMLSSPFTVKEVYITQENEVKTRRESLLKDDWKMKEAPKIKEEPKTREDFMKCELLWACSDPPSGLKVFPNMCTYVPSAWRACQPFNALKQPKV